MKIIAIDPGNVESAYVIIDEDMKPFEFGKVKNEELIPIIDNADIIGVQKVAIEMIASYGMPVGAEVFETCLWIGRFIERAKQKRYEVSKVYRKDVKLNICQDSRAKDANIRQALIDRFGEVGTKKNPGWFYGFKADIWSAYAVGVTYLDSLKRSERRYT